MFQKIKISLQELKPIDLFLFVSLSITVLFVICNIFANGALFEKCVMKSGFLFSDYFYHIAGSSDTSVMYSYGDPYSFPPFAYFLYSFLWSLNPYKDGESILNWQNYRNADNALAVFVIYNMLFVVFFLYAIGLYFKEQNVKYRLLLPTALLFSYPFLCTSVQRGNAVMLVAVFLMIAWAWMDSENKVRQEAAMFFIAAAAGFKLYPALTGIVYLKRKEWKKAARLVLYGMLVVFVPFLFFGGLDGMNNLIHTLTGFATYIDANKTNTVCGMAKWLGEKIGWGSAETFAVAVNYLFLAVSILCFFLCRKKWQEALFISGVLVSFLPSNWEYTLVYYLPVLFLLLKEYDMPLSGMCRAEKIWTAFHSIAFALVFSVDFFMLYYRYGLVSGIFTVTYLVLFVNMAGVVWEWFRNRSRTMS